MAKRSYSRSDVFPESFTGFFFAGNPSMKIAPGVPTARTLQLGQGNTEIGEDRPEVVMRHVHALSVGPLGYTRKDGDTENPKKWAYLPMFIFEVEKYRHMTNRTNQEIADDLDISKNYFQSILYGQKIPGMEVVLMASMIFSVPPTRFSDHPAIVHLVEQFGRRLKVR